jgi:hypothetical protein
MWPGLFRALDGNIETGMARNGKWVYRGKLMITSKQVPFQSILRACVNYCICSVEHSNMIRGLVGRERLLEWTVEDGWEPLCEFLGKPIYMKVLRFFNVLYKRTYHYLNMNAQSVMGVDKNLMFNYVL